MTGKVNAAKPDAECQPTVNKNEWNSFKDKVVKIQDRLRIVSFALQAVPTGVAMSRRLVRSLKPGCHY
jgi:hypothetical protein